MDDLTMLALAARNGDQVALHAFVRRTQGEVWRLCAHLTDREAADDVTQDVYLRVLRALPSFRGESSARTWLLSIAHRACADHIRARVRRRRALDAVARRPASATVAEDHAGVELDALLSGLDPDRRAAFVLTQLIGLSYEEAAAVVRVRVGTIRSRVARARARMIDAMDDEAETGTTS